MSGHSFQYGRAANIYDARIQASKPGTAFLAGGTDNSRWAGLPG